MLEFDGITKRYGARAAVEGISLTIGRGEFVALVGASGSGKSTLLKTVNRLVEPDKGAVRIAGEDVSELSLPLLRRRIGYVFQEIGLFPHMTVSDARFLAKDCRRWASCLRCLHSRSMPCCRSCAMR